MATKFDYQLFAAGKWIGKSEAAAAFKDEYAALVRKHRRILRCGPGLMAALVDTSTPEAVGVVSNDSGTLPDKLPPKVGARKAIAWAVRVHEGESCEEISSNTHSTDAETVAQAVDVTATYLDFDESEDTAAE